MTTREQRPTRRQLLRAAGALGGGALLYRMSPGLLIGDAWAHGVQQAAPQPDQLTAMRAKLGATPITVTKISDRVTMLAGPGGNVVVVHGPDGKVAVDGFVRTAWQNLKKTLDGLDSGPLKVMIDTHWHFDHADNNGNFRAAGGAVLAAETTKKRLTERHDLLGMRFEPDPPDALPTETFKDTHKLAANGEELTLTLIPPAHTDTDTFIHLAKVNVLHMGDVFFNGMYPFIDASTGGNIDGMVAGAERGLKMSDSRTKIVPGHGPLADRAALTAYRDVLATVRDRVRKAKTAGQSLADAQAAKPTADFDGTWGKGMMAPNDFVALVYNTLK